MKLINSGSVKDVYQVSENEIEFHFSDKISVFDKPIPSFIPHKGHSLCQTTTHWFEVAREKNIHTHYIDTIAPDKMRVKKVNIIHDYDAITPTTSNYLIPCEFILRHYVAGSFLDRVKSGKLDYTKAGFNDISEVVAGARMPEPYFEISTKLEPVDRFISREEALAISKISEDEMDRVKAAILEIDKNINETSENNGLIHVDGKKEFAMDENRNLMLIDVFGTADEDRFWDAEMLKKGEFLELSKEHARNYYKETGYKDALYQAREEGREEPPIPPLPDNVIKELSELYIDLYERITGKTFDYPK